MWKRARPLSPIELEYLKAHADYPINQLCIALSNTKNQIKKALGEVGNKKGKAKKALPGNKHRSNIGKRPDLNNQFFRSSWEANFYRYLKHTTGGSVRIKYEPEDFTFWQFGIKKGTVSYTPDFKIEYIDEYGKVSDYEWIEVKGGFLRNQDKTKIRRFQKYFPDEAKHLKAVTPGLSTKTALFFKEVGVPIKAVYPDLNKEYKKVIPNWE